MGLASLNTTSYLFKIGSNMSIVCIVLKKLNVKNDLKWLNMESYIWYIFYTPYHIFYIYLLVINICKTTCLIILQYILLLIHLQYTIIWYAYIIYDIYYDMSYVVKHMIISYIIYHTFHKSIYCRFGHVLLKHIAFVLVNINLKVIKIKFINTPPYLPHKYKISINPSIRRIYRDKIFICF